MQPQLDKIQEKLSNLPPNRLLEVADFIDFLQQRDQDILMRDSYSNASENAFNEAWNNSDDAAYDDL
ncbi:toxin-antitoxin system, antitoxin component, Xre family protein [Zhongshania marina]|jgi:hypothetical protein|uniref:Toxin-antitoxin system, antitoxin component, Xre family protein n=1 Tax=Zhongshania marina TaxID=2304603 RepID=A0A2S4HBW4_9GAMM|nr:toxin-antitoxin system, antitoxin component, Xre family protein [Marortus luteolus]POP51492.1 toxin-antitoxin system, antitoxin component, Xre family protein [Marortus luteolus]